MLFSLAVLTSITTAFKKPVNAVRAKWNAYVVKLSNQEAEVHITAQIPGGWYMYSQSMAGIDGPLATTIEFDPSSTYELVGTPKESGNMKRFFEPAFDLEVTCLQNQVHYVQRIKLNQTEQFSIKVMVSYMLSRNGEILPPDDDDFVITVTP